MIILWYVALVVLLLFGVKVCKNKTWNDENMSLYQTKCFLGFCAVVIVFHHIAQMTCASWLNPRFIRHGLDIFLAAGYPMVGMFLFCSGYGLYKSAKAKPDFFKRFIPVRVIPILVATLLTTLVYIGLRIWRHVPFDFDPPFEANGHQNWHPYVWYVPCIIVLYLLFYIGFGLFKKDWIGILVVALGTLGYIAFCIIFMYGTWWFNTAHMFLVGILVAKYEEKFFESCKKLYVLRIIGTILIFPGLKIMGDYGGWIIVDFLKLPYGSYSSYTADLITAIFQVLFTLTVMSLYYLLSMKLKVGNKVLNFLGGFTLELYLVHGIFIHLFGYYMIRENVKPVYYIANVPLYVLVVLVLAIPTGYALSLLDKKVRNLLRP